MAEDLDEEEVEAVEPDLEEIGDEDILEKDVVDDEDEAIPEDEEEDDEVDATPVKSATDEEEESEEEEVDDDDVEASLDVILKERLVVADEEVDEDEQPEVEDRSELAAKVMPRQPDEFACQSCFLVKHPSQLANRKRKLCWDCV